MFSGTLYNNNLSDTALWALAVDGHRGRPHRRDRGVLPVARRAVDKPALEPAFLQRVWYWDDFYDAIIGRPSQRLAPFFAWVVDAGSSTAR